jgi:hypothetical protein
MKKFIILNLLFILNAVTLLFSVQQIRDIPVNFNSLTLA